MFNQSRSVEGPESSNLNSASGKISVVGQEADWESGKLPVGRLKMLLGGMMAEMVDLRSDEESKRPRCQPL